MDLEANWDAILKIRTSGRDDSQSDTFRYPYEPTPYSVLERLAGSNYIGKNNTLVDYGCGKGRVGLFLSFQTKCHSIGVEYNERLLMRAEDNCRSAGSRRAQFALTRAEEYAVPPEADRFYFFNPFSVELMRSVMERLKESYYEAPREMLLFFYYPSDEYVSWLMTVPEIEFCDEIPCQDLFEGKNPRERILIFSFL